MRVTASTVAFLDIKGFDSNIVASFRVKHPIGLLKVYICLSTLSFMLRCIRYWD